MTPKKGAEKNQQRDTTKILMFATHGLADVNDPNVTTANLKKSLHYSLQQIIAIATRMDARTGRSDPSERKEGSEPI